MYYADQSGCGGWWQGGLCCYQMSVWATKLLDVLGRNGSAENDCTGRSVWIMGCRKMFFSGILNESESGASSQPKTIQKQKRQFDSARLRREGASK